VESDVAPDCWAELTDGELVVATVMGALAAFDELVRRYRPAVRLAARRYAGDEDAVEDLCQEAFLRAFQALSQLAEPERFAAWLHAIVRNLALRERRNGARRHERFSPLDQLLLEEVIALDPSPAEELERSEAQRIVGDAIEALPPAYRDLLYLHYWEGMPLPRVAAFVHLPLTTVKWRLRSARERLRRELEVLEETHRE
jgi:RNA polymerase sigma-70 factor (ECF subfamily)